MIKHIETSKQLQEALKSEPDKIVISGGLARKLSRLTKSKITNISPTIVSLISVNGLKVITVLTIGTVVLFALVKNYNLSYTSSKGDKIEFTKKEISYLRHFYLIG